MPAAVKKAFPKKILRILVTAAVLAAALAAVLFFTNRTAEPVMRLGLRTYRYGMALKKTEKLYEHLAKRDCDLGTRTVDGREFVTSLSARKAWPDEPPASRVSIGGLHLDDTEETLLRKYPMATTDGPKITAGMYNADETYETFTVCFSDGKPYSPAAFEALLAALPADEAEQTLRGCHALLVHTVQDRINVIVYGDYYDTLQKFEAPFIDLYS